MKKVEFIPEAREEFMAEVSFYEAAQPGLGARFSSSVEKAVSMVVAVQMLVLLLFPVRGVLSLKDFLFGFFTSHLKVAT